MAVGIDFPEANTTLGAPTPEDAAAGTVYGLRVCQFRDLDGNPNVASCWKLSEEELKQIAETGVVWFSCWGKTHAPMMISAEKPVEFKNEGN